MRDYTPFIYDLSKCTNAFYCHIQVIRTDKNLKKADKVNVKNLQHGREFRFV